MIPHLYGLPTAGDRVGDYRIVGPLGEGGHGHVYRAEAFGRSFAVKFMDPGLEAFGKREVQALMRLHHPGVVGFMGCGRWKDPERGLFYVVMELVEGLTLYDYLLEYNPTARKVGQMMLSLGCTLLAVEEAGVLHRDVKRENIMVRLPSQEPVVLDFGLSTLRGASSSGGGAGVTGTLEYLSPEAWRHMTDEEERYRPTAKDEQWALGVTFYWMLTDRLPFGERADPCMTRRVLRQRSKAPHDVNSRVPPELGTLCMRMLEKDPRERYADLREMCAALRRAMEASAGVERWEVPLGNPSAPECRTTEIDPAILAAQGIELEFLKIQAPRRGRVRKRPERDAPTVAPAEPVPMPAPAAVAAAAVAAPVPVPLGPLGERKGSVPALALVSVTVPLDGGMFWRAARRAAAWTFILGLAIALRPTLTLESSERLPGGEVSDLPAWQVGSWDQKLAPAPHSNQAAPGVALTPAPVAEATLPQDEPDVKTPVKKTGLGPAKRNAAAAVAAMALGCSTAQVRPPPEPMDCPPGALEDMAKLGLEPGDRSLLVFASLAFGTSDATWIPVKEGWTSFRGKQWPENKEPWIKWVSGKVLFGGDRVYVRLTQATLSDGTPIQVCMELHDTEDHKRGLQCQPTSSPDTVKVWSTTSVRVVDHFE